MLNDNLPADAQILPFYLADGSDDVALIRGRMASVGRAASTILARHAYPEIVAILQAEALALAACLSSTLKFDGVFTLQAKGDGPGSHFICRYYRDRCFAGLCRIR